MIGSATTYYFMRKNSELKDSNARSSSVEGESNQDTSSSFKLDNLGWLFPTENQSNKSSRNPENK